MPSAAAFRGRALVGLPLLGLALLALIPSAVATRGGNPDGCPTGEITLHLVAGNAAGLTADPYAVCFPVFRVTVTSSGGQCTLSVRPDPIVDRLKWGNAQDSSNGADDCPKSTAALSVPVNGRQLATINSALLLAMRKASFSTSALVDISVTSSRMRAIMNTPDGNSNTGADLVYVITNGDLDAYDDDIEPADSTSDACGIGTPAAVPDCAGGSSNNPARYNVPLSGNNNRNIRALCPAGHSCSNNVRTACPAGQATTFVGSSSCTPCEEGSYTDAAGNSHCTPCPSYSYAHFSGSTGCLACFFGEPRLVAGILDGNTSNTTPLFPNNMPAERPSPGYRIFQAAADFKSGPNCALGGSNPFLTCAGSTASRMLAVETDATCVVRVFVLGDTVCSKMDSVAVVQGAYRDLARIESRAEDVVEGVTLAATNSTLSLAKSGSTCTTGLARQGQNPSQPSGCPLGTDLDQNVQSTDGTPVFVQRSCAPCEPGMQCGTTPVNSNSRSLPCPVGNFSDVWGAQLCQACMGMTASITPGAVRCQECAAGTTPTLPTRSSCQNCPAGTFSNVTGQACQPCPAGTYREAGGDGTECVKCSPGTYASGMGRSACTECERGSFAPDEGAIGCSACPAGSAANVTGSQECDICEPGFFSDKVNSTTCTRCSAGQITVANGNNGATGCTPCLRGTFRPDNATDNKCQSCPAGWYTNNVGSGASTCLPCPAGTFSPIPNSMSCTPCTGANYTDVQAARACKICPAGTVATGPSGLPSNSNGNPQASGSTRCVACPRRTFRPSIMSSNTCTSCPAGRETRRETGASVCQACIPGTSLLSTGGQVDINCTACPVGTFSDAPGRMGACSPCATGNFAADTGNQRCDVCAPGTYQDRTNQTACIECPVGTYSEMTGAKAATDCKLAPRGNFAEGAGNDGFTPCLAGTFQDKEGQGACKDCPPGNACPAGSINPRPCAAGFFAEPKSPFCRECPRGQFQDRPGQRACKPCPAGQYCPNTKTSKPTACPPGTFNRNVGQAVATACVRCPVNSYSNSTTGVQQCLPCSNLGSNLWTGRLTGQSTCWSTSLALPTAAAKSGRR